MIGLHTPGGTIACKPHFRAGGVTVPVNVYQRVAGVTVLIYSAAGGGGVGAFDASVTPAIVYGGRASSGSGPVATETATVITSPDAAYTYAWTHLSDDGGTWSAESPSAATTRFICGGVGPADTFNATFRCTVTGPTGTVTADVTATVTNYGDLSHAFL